MGSDDPKMRRSYAAPPGVVLGGIFVMGMGMGVFLTLLAASSVPDHGVWMCVYVWQHVRAGVFSILVCICAGVCILACMFVSCWKCDRIRMLVP